MELTRDNHFVPESYLKRWAGEDHKLWSYRTLVSDSRVPCWKKVSPRGVAYHRHLYTQILQGEETDALEQWFNTDYESPAQQAIHKAVSDSRMRPEDWVLLVRYLALQDLRTPARMLEMLRPAHDSKGTTIAEILEDSVQNLEESHRSGEPLQQEARKGAEDFPVALEFKPLPDQGVIGIRAHQVVGRQLWLFHLKHLLRGTATVLHQHDWTILKPWPGMSWITSDNPVVKLNYTSATEYDLNGGWGNDRANIFMPLGPQHLFFTEIGARRRPRGTVLDKTRPYSFGRCSPRMLIGWSSRPILNRGWRNLGHAQLALLSLSKSDSSGEDGLRSRNRRSWTLRSASKQRKPTSTKSAGLESARSPYSQQGVNAGVAIILLKVDRITRRFSPKADCLTLQLSQPVDHLLQDAHVG